MKKLNRNEIKHGAKKPIKIIQFGEGNFLRGFVDWIFDIINDKTDFNGGVQIIQPLQNGMGEMINQQDGLYHVMLEGIDQGKKSQSFRLITSVNGVNNPYNDYDTFLKYAEISELEFIVSNTTEAGIAFNPADKDFKTIPNAFPAKLTSFLYHRFCFFKGDTTKGLTVLPCELIESNGEKLKACILEYAKYWELPKNFKAWVDKAFIFCNTLVDRIVPGFPSDRIASIHKQLWFKDQLIVNAEHFHLWVIEGPETLKEKLHVEEAQLNIVVTNNLQKYRTRKVRILNGAHTAMVGYGLVNGFEKVADVVQDQKAGAFIRNLIFDEIIPSIEMDKNELVSYANDVLERFQNPFIKHYLRDISLNSISKFKVRVLPSLLGYIKKYNQLPTGLSTALAYLIYLYKGKHSYIKVTLKDDDSILALFEEAWQLKDEKLIVTKILSHDDIWGEDLSVYDELKSFITLKLEEIVLKNRSLKKQKN